MLQADMFASYACCTRTVMRTPKLCLMAGAPSQRIQSRFPPVASLASRSAATSKAKIEIERKFQPTAKLKALLRDDDEKFQRRIGCHDKSAGPIESVLSFHRLPDKLMRDTYYDKEGGELQSTGIWIRRRSSISLRSADIPFATPECAIETWEAKVRLGGNSTDSQFPELEDEESIRALLRQHSPDTPPEELEITADFETQRKSWLVQEEKETKSGGMVEIRIDLDEASTTNTGADSAASFNHEVGELEMVQEIVADGGCKASDSVVQIKTEELRRLLDEFMSRNSSLFPGSPKPRGKLGAYFEWKREVEDGKS